MASCGHVTLLLKGIELRYVLTMHLFQHGKQSVADLVDALDAYGFTTEGRASKAISDALRCEITVEYSASGTAATAPP